MQETQKTWLQSLGRKDALEKAMATHFTFLPEKSYGQRSLVGSRPKSSKELDTTDCEHVTRHTSNGLSLLYVLHVLIILYITSY